MGLGGVTMRRGSQSAFGWVVKAGLAALAGVIVLASAAPAEAARRKKSRAPGYNPPYAALVIDAKTGATLHAVNESALRHPASVTKVMTLYMLFEQLEAGRVRLDTALKVSANAARQAPSKIGFEPGETIDVEDAIKALVTKSANDVAVVVAENLAGSEDAFAERMTQRARSLGMSRTTFTNASGLPDPEQVTTARDLSILARAIQDRFPRYYSYFGTRVFHYAGTSYRNHNKLLGRVEGVDGIKTGYTRMSGFNLMTSAKSDGRHIVAIVLGGRSGASRDQIMAGLVDRHLPRAYAGARTAAPVVAAAEPARPRPAVVPAATATAPTVVPAAVAAKDDSRVPAEPAKTKRIDLVSTKPIAAAAYTSAPGSTATPSAFRWVQGAQPAATTAQPVPLDASGKMQDRLPSPAQSAAAATPAKPTPVATKDESRVMTTASIPSRSAEPKAQPRPASAWVIQLGATDDEAKARDILAEAKSRSRGALGQATGFTEKVTKGGATLWRARFAGFDEAEEAQSACKTLKRSGFACFATRG